MRDFYWVLLHKSSIQLPFFVCLCWCFIIACCFIRCCYCCQLIYCDINTFLLLHVAVALQHVGCSCYFFAAALPLQRLQRIHLSFASGFLCAPDIVEQACRISAIDIRDFASLHGFDRKTIISVVMMRRGKYV